MNGKKRILAIVLAMAMMITFMPAMAFATETESTEPADEPRFVLDQPEAEVPAGSDEISAQAVPEGGTAVAKIGNEEYVSLSAAIQAAVDGDTIELIADDRVSFSEGVRILRIDKNVTITGATKEDGSPKYAIYGDKTATGNNYYEMLIANNNGVGKDITISNVEITEFGNEATNSMYVAPIWVSGAYTGKLTLDNVTVSKFNRMGIVIQGGEFEINNCKVLCNKKKTEATGDVLNKGIEIDNTSTGVVRNTFVQGGESTYEDWDAAGIEYWGCGDVSIIDSTISGGSGGIVINEVIGYPGLTTGELTLINTSVTAPNKYALRIGKTSDSTGVIRVISGKFNGPLEMEAHPETVETGKFEFYGGLFSDDPSDYVADNHNAAPIKDDTYSFIVGNGAVSNSSKQIIAGKFSMDPSAYLAANYYVRDLGEDKIDRYEVYYNAPSFVSRVAASGQTVLKFSWTQCNGAASYVVYANKCNSSGKKFVAKKIATVTGTSFKLKKISGKKLKKHTYYKAYVVALDANGKEIARTNTMHVITGNVKGKYGNAKKLTVSGAVSLSKGQTSAISAKIKNYKNKKTLRRTHCAKFRYVSADPNVATVSESGVITGVNTGSTVVYVQAPNGLWNTVGVTVK